MQTHMAFSSHLVSTTLRRIVALTTVLVALFAIQIPVYAKVLRTTTPNADSGSTFPWEGSYGGTNTSNGNKLTSVPLVGWTARGGLPVNLTLYHNSIGPALAELGYGWSHSYDIYLIRSASNSNVTVMWGNGLSYTFTYSGGGSGTYTAPTGVYDTLTYAGTGSSPTAFTLKTKSRISYGFVLLSGTQWKCTSITDPNGNALTLAHNGDGYVTSVTDGNGRAITFTYNGSNRLLSVTDPMSRVFSFGYTSDDLTSVTYPDPDGVGGASAPVVTYGYTSHCVTSITDARSNVWEFSYSSGVIQWEENPLNERYTYTYGSGYTRITDPRSYYVQHNYNGSGQLSSVRDELNNTESYTYDGSNNKTRVTDKAGEYWDYTYDSRGNVLTATNPLSKVTTYTYNGLDEVLTKTTDLGFVWTWTYDANGNKLTEVNPLSQTTTYTYGTYGLLSTVTTPLSHTTTFYYDTYGNVNGITDATSRSTSANYDTLGRKTDETVLGLTTYYVYDDLGRLTSTTAPGSRTTSYGYDASGNRTSVTNALSETDTYTYDAANRLSGHTDALSRSVSYGYNTTGQKTSFTDGRSKVTTYTIDARGDVTGIGYPDSTSESWTYNSRGLVATHTDGRGIVTTNTYDDARQLTGISYSSGASSVTLAYDDDGRKISMVDGTGTTTYDYDDANRLTERSSPQGTVYYGYNSEGLKTSEGVNLATPTTFTYDNAGRMLTMVAPSGTTTYTYTTPGQLATITRANNSVEYRTYDATTGDLEEIWHRSTSGGSTLQKFTYTFDNLGRKLTETTPAAATTWDYDAAGQLIDTVRTGSNAYTTSYTYDNAGNRATKVNNGSTETYAYNDANLLTGITGSGGAASKSYTYDNDGNLTSVTTGGVTTTVTWDGAGRVTQVANGTYTDTNTYNGLGQRVGTVDSLGTSAFVLADDRIDSDVLADGFATFQHGLGLESEVRSGVTRAYHADALGSTRVISAGSGASSATREMGSFGTLLSSSGVQSPFRFAGQHGYQYDVDSQLMRAGHRFYDNSTGRFLSRDPAFDGYNWYTYCENDPVNSVDPEGLQQDFPLPGGVILKPEPPASIIKPLPDPFKGQITVPIFNPGDTSVGVDKPYPITIGVPTTWNPGLTVKPITGEVQFDPIITVSPPPYKITLGPGHTITIIKDPITVRPMDPKPITWGNLDAQYRWSYRF